MVAYCFVDGQLEVPAIRRKGPPLSTPPRTGGGFVDKEMKMRPMPVSEKSKEELNDLPVNKVETNMVIIITRKARLC